MILKYNGIGFIPGVPARDLLQADIDHIVGIFDFNNEADAISTLCKKGLYSTVKKKAKSKTTVDKIEGEI